MGWYCLDSAVWLLIPLSTKGASGYSSLLMDKLRVGAPWVWMYTWKRRKCDAMQGSWKGSISTLEGQNNNKRGADSDRLYLRVAAAADHTIPLGHVHTARMLDQVVVCSADVGVSVACYWAIDVMKDGVFVTVQIIVFKPLPRTAEECAQTHLKMLLAKSVSESRIFLLCVVLRLCNTVQKQEKRWDK